MEFTDTTPLNIIAQPSPFLQTRMEHTIVAGGNVLDILNQINHAFADRRYTRVFIGDRMIDPKYWELTYPKPGQHITIKAWPQGGGDDKNPFNFVLSIAVIAFAPQLAGALGLGAFGTQLATVGIGLTGLLAVNALFPPPTQRFATRSFQSRARKTVVCNMR